MAGRPKKLTPEQELELVVWFRMRSSIKKKSLELGISQTLLYNILRRNGFHIGSSNKDKLVREYKRENGYVR